MIPSVIFHPIQRISITNPQGALTEYYDFPPQCRLEDGPEEHWFIWSDFGTQDSESAQVSDVHTKEIRNIHFTNDSLL